MPKIASRGAGSVFGLGFGKDNKRSALYIFSSHTFTNAGATGRIGPTQALCRSAYSSVSWAANDANFTVPIDGFQKWTVPVSGSYSFIVAGAKGGDKPDYLNNGGNGIVITGTAALVAGEFIYIVVGQMGGQSLNTGSSGGGGGGGASWVWKASGTTLLFVAGGGGGIGAGNSIRNIGRAASNTRSSGTAQQDYNLGSTTYTSYPGDGNGGASYPGSDYDSGGGAGWLSNGNDGHMYVGTEGGRTQSSNFLGGNYSSVRSPYVAVGGFGGGGGASDGGGGGGGYTGGNGGRWNGVASGGGGGTSYSISNDPATSSSTNSGHGYVTITLI